MRNKIDLPKLRLCKYAMRWKFCFALFFILNLWSYRAQDDVITGRVVGRNGRPLEGIWVLSPQAKSDDFSDADGRFWLEIATKTDTLELIFKLDSSNVVRRYPFQGGMLQTGDIQLNISQTNVFIVNKERSEPFSLDRLKFNDLQKIPLGGVERFLVYTTAATSNNELTSNYNVRGGNYDENLVYVNGFLINRPFLTRSGQQEGMSFIYSAMVDQISFSAGGFDARYGDKLSSVLDIQYRKPYKTSGSAMASLLGVESHIEQTVGPRFTYLLGLRYRANGYLLNSLPAKGAYNPVFMDGQFYTTYALNEFWSWDVLGHFSSNDYRFAPETQRTDFGTVNEAYSFNIYYEGQEQTRFLTATGGTALKYQPNDKLKMAWYATVFRSVEREYFDILGQYFINELETDPSKEEFGDSVNVLGIGSFLNHARNKLDATIYHFYHEGSNRLFEKTKGEQRNKRVTSDFLWGANLQLDRFDDVLSEWRYLDSAGYSIPQTNPNEVELFETIKGRLQLVNTRYSGYLQLNTQWLNNKKEVVIQKKIKDTSNKKAPKYTLQDTLYESASRWALSTGVRSGYTDINQEFYLTPRVGLTYYPRIYMVRDGRITRREVRFKLASGLYYQPPFYREFRTFEGDLNPNVVSQKSAHIVATSEVFFYLWGRQSPFKLSADLFYKYLWDVNPYEVDNVRTRYYAANNAVGYAYGLDANLGGEFIEGITSYFKMGLLRTREDLLDDFYYDYFNADGEKIIFGFTNDDTPVDSQRVEPGYVPRPTDQLFTFGALIQDQMPNYESFSVQMGLQFGSRLPYGPPDRSRYKDTLRMKSYFRVDIGFSYDFLYKYKQKPTDQPGFWQRRFEDAILSLEVFNLLGIDNVLSKQWIQDVNGRYYSVPNNLTQRRFNLKLILRF